MPTTSFFVGNRLLPAELGGANSRLGDVTIDGLGAYFQFWLRTCLNAKLAEMGGPTDSAPVTDACLAVFPWNHSGSFMRPHLVDGVLVPSALPALWLWEESAEDATAAQGATLWYDATVRTLKVQWIFPQCQIPDGYDARSGLPSLAGAVIRKACEALKHPDFGYGTDAPGVPITTSLNLMSLAFQRGAPGMMAPTPTAGASKGTPSNQGTAQRFFPAYDATIRVVERIEAFQPDTVADALIDDTLTINHGDSVADTVEILERIIPSDLLP